MTKKNQNSEMSSNSTQYPSIKDLEDHFNKINKQLQETERRIYQTEGQYMKITQNFGNVFKGWDPQTQNLRQTGPSQQVPQNNFSQRRGVKAPHPERQFSNSSLTAPKNDDDYKRYAALESVSSQFSVLAFQTSQQPRQPLKQEMKQDYLSKKQKRYTAESSGLKSLQNNDSQQLNFSQQGSQQSLSSSSVSPYRNNSSASQRRSQIKDEINDFQLSGGDVQNLQEGDEIIESADEDQAEEQEESEMDVDQENI